MTNGKASKASKAAELKNNCWKKVTTRMQEHTSYMQSVDLWTDKEVIGQLMKAWSEGNKEAWAKTVSLTKRAIREKLLESYRNGQVAQYATEKPPVKKKWWQRKNSSY